MKNIRVSTNNPDLTQDDVKVILTDFCKMNNVDLNSIDNISINLPLEENSIETKVDKVKEKVLNLKELKTPFTYGDYHVYMPTGEILNIEPQTYNAINHITTAMYDNINSKETYNDFDSLTIRKSYKNAIDIAINNFAISVSNRYDMAIREINNLFINPEDNSPAIIFFSPNSEILEEMKELISMNAHLKFVNATYDERAEILNGSFYMYLISETNKFAYEVYNDIRNQLNDILMDTSINLSSEIVKDFLPTTDQIIGSMMADVVFEVSLLVENIKSVNMLILDDVRKDKLVKAIL